MSTDDNKSSEAKSNIGISPKVYQQIVDAFRERGWAQASYGEIGRVVGLDHRKVARAWLYGVAARGGNPAMPPIKQVALDEMRTNIRYRVPGLAGDLPASPFVPTPPVIAMPVSVPAPALVPIVPIVPSAPIVSTVVTAPAPALPATGNITRADIEEHAQEALRAELRAIAAVRDSAVGAAVSARKMLGALQGRLDRMAEEIADEDARGNKVDPVATSKLIHRILIVADKASAITKQVIESERLALGSPTEIIKVMEAPTVGPDVNAEAAARSEKVLAFLSGRRKERAALPAGENRFVEEVEEEAEPVDPVEAVPVETELDEADKELDAAEKDPEDSDGTL